MHLKNFSLLYEPDGVIRLSPAYDLLPTRLLLPADREESALTVNGKKSRLQRGDFDALATTLGLTNRQITNSHARLQRGLAAALEVISNSFLSPDKQEAFRRLITDRAAGLWD